MHIKDKFDFIPVITGPTASGKTGLSVEVAKAFNKAYGITGEIVCADSMQIYDELSIGTARPAEKEMDGVPHHLFGFLPVDQKYNVADYAEVARKTIKEIWDRGNQPILVGGTGLYVNTITENLQFSKIQGDKKLRAQLEKRAELEGNEVLYDELRQLDPDGASELHPNNIGRVIRALELVKETGMTIKERTVLSKSVPPSFKPVIIYLNYRDRQTLYNRINCRADFMVENGLINEAEKVMKFWGNSTATQAIGYKEVIPYINGKITLEKAKDDLKQATRRYAKRQMTWFRKIEDKHEIFVDDYDSFNQVVQTAIDIIFKEMGA